MKESEDWYSLQFAFLSLLTSPAVNNVLGMIRFIFMIYMLICMVSFIWTIDSISLRTYFNCQPCDETECLDLPTNCAELVKGPGVCNCCLVCARSEGESCGVNTPRCATGLECSPVKNNGPQATWSTFMQDKGVCRPSGMSTFSLKHFYWSKLRCQK